MNPTGTHILAEYSGCNSAILNDREAVEELLVAAAKAAGATVVAHKSHRLDDSGVISVVVLQESHLSIHTWPHDGWLPTSSPAANATRITRILYSKLG